MLGLTTLFQGVGLAYAAGLNLYAVVAITGLAIRMGWVTNVPSSIEPLASIGIIAIALGLYVVEFAATLIPGVASAWETLHSLIRPPAAAVLAAATAWHADPVVVLVAALLGGGVAITTHTTKLGVRYAIDASPEPLTNGVANLTELGVVAGIAIAIWSHPFITLGVAIVVLALMMVLVRLIWRSLRRVFSGHWMPRQGLMQAPRVMERRVHHLDEDE
jgi:hypothetical protein